MNTPGWSGGRLLAVALLLTATGACLLYAGLGDTTSAAGPLGPRTQGAASWHPAVRVTPSASPPGGQADPMASPEPQISRQNSPGSVPTPSVSGAISPAPVLRELPPPGSGPAADPLIQQALDQASAPDLSPTAEQQVLALGRTAWLAETAGYKQVRIQAATARRDTPPTTGAPSGAGGRYTVLAVVRLVWAGADPAGTFMDGRTATVRFTQNGEGTWNRTS